MNVSLMNIGTDAYKKGSYFAGGLPFLQNDGLKSTQEQLERKQKAQSQVSFWEKQKENLKNMECDSLEEIAKKLETLHGYEDEIAAAKKSFNNEQMWHVMDEARELGEKIAEAAEKMEPKTPEERREETAKEALGTEEENGGALEEMLDEAAKMQDEVTQTEEELLEETDNMEELAEGTDSLQEKEEALQAKKEEAKEVKEQQEKLEEEKLAARREARNLEAYKAAGRKYSYQALDLRA